MGIEPYLSFAAECHDACFVGKLILSLDDLVSFIEFQVVNAACTLFEFVGVYPAAANELSYPEFCRKRINGKVTQIYLVDDRHSRRFVLSTVLVVFKQKLIID